MSSNLHRSCCTMWRHRNESTAYWNHQNGCSDTLTFCWQCRGEKNETPGKWSSDHGIQASLYLQKRYKTLFVVTRLSSCRSVFADDYNRHVNCHNIVILNLLQRWEAHGIYRFKTIQSSWWFQRIPNPVRYYDALCYFVLVFVSLTWLSCYMH